MVVLILCLSLTACTRTVVVQPTEPPVATTQPAVPPVTPTTPPAPPSAPSTPSQADREAAFLQAVYDNVPEFRSVPADVALDLGYAICADLDSGTPVEEVFRAGLDNGFSEQAVGFITGAAVGAFCPQHTHIFDNIAA